MDDLSTAVCILPGTEVAFAKEVTHQSFVPAETRFRVLRALFGMPSEKTWQGVKTRPKIAVFRQVNKDQPHTHHDALEFPDGEIVLLTRLFAGQEATVLQLPASRISSGAEEPTSAPVTNELVRSAWSLR